MRSYPDTDSRFDQQEAVGLRLIGPGPESRPELFLVIFPHIDLFRFEAKYKPRLKLNLDMDPGPSLEGLTTPYWSGSNPGCRTLFIL
jgi:hypothetical protein